MCLQPNKSRIHSSLSTQCPLHPTFPLEWEESSSSIAIIIVIQAGQGQLLEEALAHELTILQANRARNDRLALLHSLSASEITFGENTLTWWIQKHSLLEEVTRTVALEVPIRLFPDLVLVIWEHSICENSASYAFLGTSTKSLKILWDN